MLGSVFGGLTVFFGIGGKEEAWSKALLPALGTLFGLLGVILTAMVASRTVVKMSNSVLFIKTFRKKLYIPWDDILTVSSPGIRLFSSLGRDPREGNVRKRTSKLPRIRLNYRTQLIRETKQQLLAWERVEVTRKLDLSIHNIKDGDDLLREMAGRVREGVLGPYILSYVEGVKKN